MMYGGKAPPGPNQLPGRHAIGVGGVSGKSGQEAVARDQSWRQRKMGGDFANRGAFQTDFSQANEARGQQMGALGLSRDAAMGNAPSRAEKLAQRMGDNSVSATMAAAAGARGGPAGQAAALRNAQNAQAIARQKTTNDIGALRADEMARARGELMAGSSALRAGDLQTAGIQTQNELAQRGLNQQGQLAMEGYANDIDKAQAMVDLGMAQDDSANWRAMLEADNRQRINTSQVNQHSKDRETNALLSIFGGAASGVGGALGSILSDEKSKTNVRDMTTGEHPPWMPDEEDVDAIRFGPNASDDALDDRYADGARPPPAWLEEEMRPPPPPTEEKGVAGAPRGYASRRRAPMGSSLRDEDGRAPGSADWDRYGAGAKREGDPDWTKGGSTPKPDAKTKNTKAAIAGGFQKFGERIERQPTQSMGYAFVSDPFSKSEMSPLSGPAPVSFGGPGGLLGGSVMGEDKAHKSFGTRFQRDPVAGPVKISDPAAKRAAFSEGFTYGQGELFWGSKGEANKETLPDYMKKTREPTRSGDGRMLTVEGPATATRIDPKARGERPPPSPDAWGRSTESGPQRPSMQGLPKDPRTGERLYPSRNDPMSAPPAQMMDAIGGGKTFSYKPGVPGEDPNKQHFGTTTADLKRTPMGASMVQPAHPSTGGYETIDVREAVGPTLAGLGNLNQRLRRLEATAAPPARKKGR